MSSSNYREINNALNNYYGNKMKLYVVGSEFREEYRQKMREQQKLVEELSIKAEAFDECEAKAKAWDKLMFEIDEINDEVAGKEFPSKIIMAAKITALSNVMKEYESGKSE